MWSGVKKSSYDTELKSFSTVSLLHLDQNISWTFHEDIWDVWVVFSFFSSEITKYSLHLVTVKETGKKKDTCALLILCCFQVFAPLSPHYGCIATERKATRQSFNRWCRFVSCSFSLILCLLHKLKTKSGFKF